VALSSLAQRQDVIDARLKLLALGGGQVALDLEHCVVRGETDLGLALLGLGLFSNQLAGRSATSVHLGGQLLQGIQDLRHLPVMVTDMEGDADGIEPALPHRPNAYLVLGQVFVEFRVFDRLHFEADHRRTVGLLLGRQDFDAGDLLQAPVKPPRFSGELSIIWPLTAVWRECYIILRKLGRSVDPQRE